MSRNNLPSTRVPSSVRNMFNRFDVDTQPVAQLLEKFGVPPRRIGKFAIDFDPLKPAGETGDICGFYNYGLFGNRNRIHVIAGQISDGAFDNGVARPGHEDPTSFEAIIAHEIGHYLWINNDLKRAPNASEEENEAAAMLFERKCTPPIGSIVSYEFKPEFIDAAGVQNYFDTWDSLDHPWFGLSS